MQKDGIKVMIKFFQLILCHSGAIRQCLYIIELLCFNLPVYVLTKFIQFTDISGTDSKYITDILLFYIIGFPQLTVRFL